MRYMLCFIQLCDQCESIQKPFNKWPGTSIVRRRNKKLTTWICQFIEQAENIRHLMFIEMLDDFDTVDSVEWLLTFEVAKLTQAKLEVGRSERLSGVAYRR